MSIEQKERIVEALAHALADNLVEKSVALEIERNRGRPSFAEEWARLRTVFCISGWMTYSQTHAALTELFKTI